MARMTFDDYGCAMAKYNTWQNNVLYEIEAFVASDDRDWQDGYREFTGVDGITRNLPRPLFLVQFFNHQTHHRSQITSELHKMGIDYGITDVPLTPDISW